jgi:outer membrane lipoprotein SlyB
MTNPNTLPVVAAPPPSMLGKLRLHPLIALAALCVILLSLTGVAAMTGLLKPSTAQEGATPAALAANVPPPATATATSPTGDASPAGKGAAGKTESQAPAVARPRPVAAAPGVSNLGVVESVQAIKTQGDATGVGAVAGGVLGGVLGHQVGGGNGKKVATVAGAVGGGLLGNHVEKNMRGSTTYNITVRMDNGERRTVKSTSANAWQVGERVRVDNGRISAAG